MTTDTAVRTDSVLNATTVCEAFQITAALHAERVALRTKGDGTVMLWREYADCVRALAGGLAGLGIEHGDTVATQLVNRPEFHLIDLAAAHIGAVPFGVYNTSAPQQIVDRLENADCRIIITEMAFLPTVMEALAIYGRIQHVVVVDGPADGTMSLAELEAAAVPDFDFESSWRAVRPNDLLTMIYTSGTTGPPKGAQWTHGAVARFLKSWGQALPFPTSEVSYLPLAHAGERMLTHYMPLAAGATVTCCPSVREVFAHIVDARPDFFVTVPRTWSMLKSTMLAYVDDLDDFELKTEITTAINVSLERVELDWTNQPVPAALAESHDAVQQTIREKLLRPFGLDRMKVGFIGSAPPPPEDVKFFRAAGVLLLEGYGLTEATAFASVWPRMDDHRYGRVGKPLPGVELKLLDDGEILLRSDMNMAGYRKEPKATADALDGDGWLHTGDIGRLDDDGYLAIIDRKKALIINNNGKNMSPANIETEIQRETRLIAQIVAIGNNQDYVTALITLDPEATRIYMREQAVVPSTASPYEHEAVIAEISAAVDRGNRRLSAVEQVKRFKILPVEWQPDSDELTPTMKVKRKPVEEKYAAEIAALYER
jgi:long-chain acyl-CoA synthetase